ncbi:MAG TPA: type II toxin-antitoxin system PemK/MazF family toxin [Acetobacteraceae bacterium]|nr:type II toxin-antitoxin system PemK/MazF family toxin [Acetobacteraceae bacterium]
MSDEPLSLAAGQIVLADWRGDALPREPGKLRPAVVVEDDALFGPHYPNAILVPLTEDTGLIMPSLAVAIEPTSENGCRKPCWAAAHLLVATSKQRIRPTASRVTEEQLSRIRRRVASCIAAEPRRVAPEEA